MARDVLAEGRFLRLIKEDGWEWAERTNASGVVVVVALTPEGRVLLVEQHRPPVRGRVIELPAGLAGDLSGAEDEALEVAARRELEEETGWTAARIVRLTAGPVSAGMTSESLTFLRAEGLRRCGAGGGDETEDIVVHEIPLDDADAWLAARAAEGVRSTTQGNSNAKHPLLEFARQLIASEATTLVTQNRRKMRER